jgi:hypothetical protein
MAVSARSGIPRRALVLNLAVMVIFLLPFGGWQNIVAVMGDMYLLIYAASAVAAASFRAADRRLLTGWVPGMGWIAPLSFVAASEFIYWSGWHDLRLALPLVLVGVPLFLALWPGNKGRDRLLPELSKGAWLVFYLLVLTLLSWLGSFKGSGTLPAPWDSVVVGVVALAVFRWAVRSGRSHVQSTPSGELGLDQSVNS